MSERQKKKLAQREANRLKRRMIEKVLSSSRTSVSTYNLNLLVDGWLELESDPGTFSLLIEDFGCSGAQVDEIYDLEQKFDSPVFGFIFLFKWLNNQTSDRSRNQKSSTSFDTLTDRDKEKEQPPEMRHWSYIEDENIIGEMFFAKQMISNSCATHALISILLNCDYDELNLGPVLTRLKEHTRTMNPENKGYAIGNLPELAKAHNSHASYSSLYNRNKFSSHSSGMSYMISGNQRTNLQQQKQHEAYHFVSYVPINNRLYELDGLKSYPIDHGPIGPKEDWTEKFRTVIKHRLQANKMGDDPSISNDIRYSLMAVVPDRRVCLRAQLRKLKYHNKIVQDSIRRLTKRVFTPLSVDIDIPNPPYSPLSNGTLTASEAGSVYNSPSSLEDNFFLEDEKVDKYFFVKFDQQLGSNPTREENVELAHKNCIIEIESTNVHPVNLSINLGTGDDSRRKDCTSDLKQTNNCKVDQLESDVVTTGLETPRKNEDLKLKMAPATTGPELIQYQEIQSNGLPGGGDIRINELPAHSNEKYNLSTKPPFDFNILDEMQHVHHGKSTLKELKALCQRLVAEIDKLETSLREEIDKRRRYKIDNSRRTHNYEPFIMTFLSMLAKQGKLADLIEKDLGLNSEEPAASQAQSAVSKSQNHIATSTNKAPATNGGSATKTNNNTPKVIPTQKPKYKYVSTGRPVGRPRKNPLIPPPVKTPNTK